MYIDLSKYKEVILETVIEENGEKTPKKFAVLAREITAEEPENEGGDESAH